MASAIAMMVGGALVNALAFSGSNFAFSMLRDSGVDEERKRHDKALEQLQAAQVDWSRKRTERLDWINEEMRRQGHAVRTFRDADEAIRQYNLVVGSGSRIALEPKPKLSDFYQPSPEQRDREIAFVIMGLGVTSFAAYYMLK